MNKRPVILMTARDAGPAQHLVEIALKIRESGDYDLHIHTQEPAGAYFHAAGLNPTTVTAPYAPHGDEAASRTLHDTADSLLTLNPALTICAFSTTYDTIGIDEAVTARASGPVMILQDSAGTASIVPDRGNQHYLCVSPDADNMRARGYAASFIGPAKLEAFKRKDYEDLAVQFRKMYGPALYNRPVVTFCGQYLTESYASRAPRHYERILKSFAKSAAQAGAFVIYRPHPREWAREDAWYAMRKISHAKARELPCDVTSTARIFKKYLGENIVVEQRGLPQDLALAGSDAVVSYCSGSLIDLVYMNYFSSQALATPIALMWDDAYNAVLKVTPFTQMENSRGVIITHPSRLANMIEESRVDSSRAGHWLAARHMDFVDNGAMRALEVIRRALPQTRRRQPAPAI